MKSLSIGGVAGQVKLRGKKSCVLSCGCCDVRNFKDDYDDLLAEREIQEFKIRPVAGDDESLEEVRGCTEQG